MDLYYMGTMRILRGTSRGVFIFTDGFQAEGSSEEVFFNTGVINHSTLLSDSLALLINIHLEQKHKLPLFILLLMFDAPVQRLSAAESLFTSVTDSKPHCSVLVYKSLCVTGEIM